MKSSPPSLGASAAPDSLEDQRQVLRKLRNEIIGSRPKKEAWSKKNLLPMLTSILNAASSDSSKWNGESGHVTLDAITILASLAHENAEFVREIELRQVLPVLIRLSNVLHLNNAISLASLRALDNIAEVTARLVIIEDTESGLLGSLIHSQTSLDHLHQVLQHVYNGRGSVQHAELIARIITKTCTSEARKTKAVAGGLLQDLVSCLKWLLLTMPVRAGHGVPQSSQDTFKCGYIANSGPATILLKATAAIVRGSQRRAKTYLHILTATLEYSNVQEAEHTAFYMPTESPVSPEYRVETGQSTTPSLSTQYYETLDSTTNSRDPAKVLFRSHFQGTALGGRKNLSSALTWMLHLTQSLEGLARLSAIWNVILLVRCGSFLHTLEMSIIRSLIPSIMQIMQLALSRREERLPRRTETLLTETRLQILEDAPHILAICINNERDLQGVSVEAEAVPNLFAVLQASSETLPEYSSTLFWCPGQRAMSVTDAQSSQHRSIHKSPQAEVSRSLYHHWRVKKAVLEAFAAIASQEDEYRKAIVEHSVVSVVVESLRPLNEASLKVSISQNGTPIDGCGTGNPTPVLLAACEVAKALCRSVDTLRTSLADANLAAPLAVLLNHFDENVQIAATAAVCNIVLEFSPMRQTAVDTGMMKVLCAHARSQNPKLRLNSIWALKHLVHSAPNKLKIDCINGLGVGWLKEALEPIYATPRSFQLGSEHPAVMKYQVPPGPWPKTINALAVDEEDEEVHMIGEPLPSTDETSVAVDLEPLQLSTSTVPHFGEENTIDLQVDTESDPLAHSKTVAEVLALKEQVLDFVRNLVAGRSNHEMADYIIRDVGQDKLITMLTDLLSEVQGLESQKSKYSLGQDKDVSTLILAVLYIVCNFAGSLPRHQQLIISAKDLLLRLMPLFHHPFAEIRKTCVWIVINLTWTKDQEDRVNCKARAYELRKLGALDQLKLLADDTDLDVRERARTAIRQIADQLENQH